MTWLQVQVRCVAFPKLQVYCWENMWLPSACPKTSCCIPISHCDSQHILFWEFQDTYKLDINNKYHYHTWENTINWFILFWHHISRHKNGSGRFLFCVEVSGQEIILFKSWKDQHIWECILCGDLALNCLGKYMELLNTTRAFSLQTLACYMTFFLTDTFFAQIM